MDPRQELLSRVDAFCAAKGMTRAGLAAAVLKDNKFFARLERGGGFTDRTYRRFVEYIEASIKADAEKAA